MLLLLLLDLRQSRGLRTDTVSAFLSACWDECEHIQPNGRTDIVSPKRKAIEIRRAAAGKSNSILRHAHLHGWWMQEGFNQLKPHANKAENTLEIHAFARRRRKLEGRIRNLSWPADSPSFLTAAVELEGRMSERKSKTS